MTVSLQNRLPNSREHPCLWPPWGVKFNYFDQKWPEIDLFLLITLKYEALNDTKQPHYDIYNNVLHYFFYFFKYLSLAIGNNTKQYHPRGSKPQLGPEKTQIWNFQHDTSFFCKLVIFLNEPWQWWQPYTNLVGQNTRGQSTWNKTFICLFTINYLLVGVIL